MSLTLSKDKEARKIEPIKRHFYNEMDTVISDFKATLLLEYVLQEFGRVVYNQAAADARAFMNDKINDLGTSSYF